MNTKEAMSFLTYCKVKIGEYSKIDQVIDMIERGEKYEAIVKEMEEFLEPGMIFEIPEGMVGSRHIDIIKYTFEKLKQKYFPEPVKKYITIEVESEKESEVDAGMEDIKELVDNMGCPKMKIANEWKEE